MTITEALAEIKTIDKRMEKKREFVKQYLARQGHLKDPFEKDGGSYRLIEQERQAIRDLGARKVALRRAISVANAATSVEIQGVTRTIADWIIWRREVAPGEHRFLVDLRGAIASLRRKVSEAGAVLVNGEPTGGQEVTVNIDEKKLVEESELADTVLGELDGVLSLKNATVQIDL